MGAELQRLYGNRKKADYHDVIAGNLSGMAEDTLLAAEQLIANLGSL